MDSMLNSFKGALPALAVAGAALAAALVLTRAPGLPLDDAYIHLTFARNLADGHGLSFNPGEFSLGFSSILWITILALIIKTGLEPIAAVTTIGAVCFSLSAVLLYRLVRTSLTISFSKPAGPHPRLDRTGQWCVEGFSLAAGLGMAVCGNLLWLAGSGMEAMLYLMLGLAAIAGLIAPRHRPIAGGVALGLFILTRPTGLALAALLLARAALRAPGRRRTMAGTIIAAAIAAPWFTYTFIVTGQLLPTTHAGKLASNLFNSGFAPAGIKTYILKHLQYLLIMDRGLWLLLVAALAAGLVSAVIVFRHRKTGPAASALTALTNLTPAAVITLWAVGEFALYAVLFRSAYAVTPYHLLRYHVMLIPALIAAAATALAGTARRLSETAPSRPPAPASAPGSLPLVYVAALAALTGGFVVEAINLPAWRDLYAHNAQQLQQVHRAAAQWTRANTRAEDRIACLDIGMLGYYSDRYIIDLGGLIDPGVHAGLTSHRVGPWLVEKRADYYFAMVRHDSDRLTGVMQDNGKLFNLEPITAFNYPAYASPVILHSLGLVVYRVKPPP